MCYLSMAPVPDLIKYDPSENISSSIDIDEMMKTESMLISR